MADYKKILVVQTAFPGDVILTLPMIQLIRQTYPSAEIDCVVIPKSSELLQNHLDIHETIVYDKRGADRGFGRLLRVSRKLKQRKYDVAVVPHRSMRSALLVRLAGIPRRIGFDRSAGRFMFTDIIRYDASRHEVERNVSLLSPIGIRSDKMEIPHLYPSPKDVGVVDQFLSFFQNKESKALIAVAPGTVWNTKRWLPERFDELHKKFIASGFQIVLIGGKEDSQLCEGMLQSSSSKQIVSSAGRLTLLQSAELIRRCRVLVSNDSAPMHLAVAVQTPVVAIFGATIPGFGFAPYGKHDAVIETDGLSCRPCSIHGGNKCPITTFDCMVRISSDAVFSKVMEVIEHSHAA